MWVVLFLAYFYVFSDMKHGKKRKEIWENCVYKNLENVETVWLSLKKDLLSENLNKNERLNGNFFFKEQKTYELIYEY